MARKSSGASWVLILAAVVLVGLAEAIKNYWPALLVIGGAALAFWLFRKSAAQTPALQQDGSVTLRVSVGSGQDLSTQDYSFNRQKPTVRDGDELWLSEGKSINVGGYLLNGGFLYVGKGLDNGNGWQIEAALIDPSLPVNQRDDDYTVRKLNYWPSYSEASREARASYLNWLANGRSDPRADVGYVFLYFYALERRVLVDTTQSESAKAELPAIMREVERLLGIYSGSYSFQRYAGSLLEFLKASQTVVHCPDSPVHLSVNGELTFAHRLCLGQISNLRKALPGEWAYLWLRGDPTTRLKTAAQRCPEEFKRAFLNEYSKKFGAGLLLPQNKTRLKVSYRPASPSLQGSAHLEKHFDLPDVTVLIRWLRGEFTTKTDAKAALGVRTIVDDASFYDQLKLMSRFTRLAGYSGLLLNLDEMVNLYKLANAQARNSNYEQILRILNDSLQGTAEGLGVVMGGTPDFLMDTLTF
ncbi:MAG: TerB N-terminal domain-containing protein [Thiobacillus sp.]|nr:TerB N-terminal domain-containing protein [Thiobacillus sp.]